MPYRGYRMTELVEPLQLLTGNWRSVQVASETQLTPKKACFSGSFCEMHSWETWQIVLGDANVQYWKATNCTNLKKIFQKLTEWGFYMLRFRNMEEIKTALPFLTLKNQLVLGYTYWSFIYQNWRAMNSKKHGRTYATPAIIGDTVLEVLTRTNYFFTIDEY